MTLAALQIGDRTVDLAYIKCVPEEPSMLGAFGNGVRMNTPRLTRGACSGLRGEVGLVGEDDEVDAVAGVEFGQ
jgi:hypothetical protein